MTEVMLENGFTFTREGNEVFAEMLAKKPTDATLSEWLTFLGMVVKAYRDNRLVWYWDLDSNAWVPGMIVDGGTKVGSRGFDVDLFAGGPLRWAEEWQVVPYSSTEPDPADLSKVAPCPLHTAYTRSA